jgi:hypothetical protein
MTHYNVSFVLEAEDVAEAVEIVGTWRVTPGVVMMSLIGSQMGIEGPLEMRTDAAVAPTGQMAGLISVAEAIAYREANPPTLERPPNVPPPPDLPPPAEVDPHKPEANRG